MKRSPHRLQAVKDNIEHLEKLTESLSQTVTELELRILEIEQAGGDEFAAEYEQLQEHLRTRKFQRRPSTPNSKLPVKHANSKAI
jgi:predicted  nucleic acid-binding Zn-ribbon protein